MTNFGLLNSGKFILAVEFQITTSEGREESIISGTTPFSFKCVTHEKIVILLLKKYYTNYIHHEAT